MRKCAHCGSVNLDTEEVCGVCGSSLAGTASVSMSQATQPRDLPTPETSQDSGVGVANLTTFFRHCPECGRRFHIKLESKRIVSDHKEPLPKEAVSTVVVRGQKYPSGTGVPTFTPINVEEGKPTLVDIEEFQYGYKCAHCGHEWFETRLGGRRVG